MTAEAAARSAAGDIVAEFVRDGAVVGHLTVADVEEVIAHESTFQGESGFLAELARDHAQYLRDALEAGDNETLAWTWMGGDGYDDVRAAPPMPRFTVQPMPRFTVQPATQSLRRMAHGRGRRPGGRRVRRPAALSPGHKPGGDDPPPPADDLASAVEAVAAACRETAAYCGMSWIHDLALAEIGRVQARTEEEAA